MSGKIKLNSANKIMNLIDYEIENTESLNKIEVTLIMNLIRMELIVRIQTIFRII